MKAIFSIDYYTAPGENPVLRLIDPSASEYAMTNAGGDRWICEIVFADSVREINYCYALKGTDGETLREEWPGGHKVSVPATAKSLLIDDRWHDVPAQLPMLSSAFTGSIFRRQTKAKRKTAPKRPMTQLQVLAPEVRPSQKLVITGNIPRLGNWNPAVAPEMDDSDFPLWKISFPTAELPESFEYKFCIVDTADKSVQRWEEYPNRVFTKPAEQVYLHLVKGLVFEEGQPSWRGTGTVIPVFSLRSSESFGIGDFHDLRLMVDWVAETGQNFLQILPINDTTMTGEWTDSYPYNAISVFALHPVYLKVEELGEIDDSTTAMLFATRKRELNSHSRIDYENVFRAKMDYARTLFEQNGAKTLAKADYRRFAADNVEWLDAYAAFCLLRDKHHTADITAWGENAVYDEERISRLLTDNKHQADFYRYLQYHLHKQLKATTDYAHTRGVIIKGDIAIGISRNSVDAWKYPRLFNLDWCAGAPPDAFAADGQNWGFPTYNWERMAEDDYSWWRGRLRKMAEYFDAYRIDHLLGFFRIWQIPKEKRSGLLGMFSPSMPMDAEEMKSRYGFEFRPEYTEPQSTLTDVLFITDPSRPDSYHPAINGHETQQFGALSQEQQLAFRRLHEDYFYNRHNEMWAREAIRKFSAILTETRMLACGEDLGMIPSCVKPVMDRLRILALEVQRMPKLYGEEWGNTAKYQYLSVATTSTHDMPGLRLWLEENPATATRLLDSIGAKHDTTDLASPECCEAVLKAHLDSPSMLCIIPWQDWMAIDGRLRRKEASEEVINIPAVSNHYWRYRMHLDIEQLLRETDFNSRLRALIARYRKNDC